MGSRSNTQSFEFTLTMRQNLNNLGYEVFGHIQYVILKLYKAFLSKYL